MATTILELPTAVAAAAAFNSPARPAGKRPRLCRAVEDLVAEEQQPLIPGLPDNAAELCLSLVPPSVLYSVCRSWRRLIYSPSYPSFPSIYALFESTEAQPNFSTAMKLCSFDPISCKWTHIPPPPVNPPLRFLVRHPSFISRRFPIQSVVVSGKLVLVAATDEQLQPALSGPLLFDPISREWTYGPSLAVPRRWCALGASRATVFVASGIGSRYKTDVALSMEKWDLDNLQQQLPIGRRQWKWEKMRDCKDGKFCREAIDAVGWRGKLCMVNVKGGAAKEGTVYDVETDSWEDMPRGMLAGWRGPATSAEEETIYVVDERRGSLKRYDESKDSWSEVAENEMLKGAQQVAAARGKVCVLRADGEGIVVVGVDAPPPVRVWVVDAPPGLGGLAIHILPRMSHPRVEAK